MTRRGGLHRSLTLGAAVLLAALAGSASAQEPVPFVPDASLPGRFADDFTLRYCIDPRDPAWEVDRDIAIAIAGALLVEPAEFVVEDPSVRESLDRLYTHLLQDCAIYFGFKLLPGLYPEWLTVTRPYYNVGYVLVTASPDWSSLGDIPPGTPISPTLGTAADFRLIQYNNSLDPARRWQRFPASSDEAALSSVISGGTEAALVWGPSLKALSATHPEYVGLRAIALDPLPTLAAPVGAVLRNTETALRTSVDRAIESLVADGTIAAIIADHDFPATMPQ